MDEFAFHDIPDSIDYILATTSQPSLSYIGFSQGTAQAFAALSIHPTLNDKVDVFIALAPAMSPAGLYNGVVDALIKASPEVIFLAFGRRILLSSATMWQALLYPPIFVRIIDMSLLFLFNWSAKNINPHQKLAAYPHLYSYTSTKSVVHWFQIIRNKSFQMYDDDVQLRLSIGAGERYYKVAKFPTRNIKTPIVLMYGGSDSLVDIDVMLKELPKHTTAKEIPHFEHLDFLWAQDVDNLVFPGVFEALEKHARTPEAAYRSLTYDATGKKRLTIALPPKYSEDLRSEVTSAAGDSDTTTDSERDKTESATTAKASPARHLPSPPMSEAPIADEREQGAARANVSVSRDAPSSSTSEAHTTHYPEREQAQVMPASPTVPSSPCRVDGAGPRTPTKASRIPVAQARGRQGRSDSVTSEESNAGATRFQKGGISLGASKATLGGVVASPARGVEILGHGGYSGKKHKC